MKKSLYSLLLILLIAGINACKPKEENPFGNKLGDINTKSEPVKVQGVVSVIGDFPIELVSNGKLVAQRKASLNFKTNGIIDKIMFKNGQWVEEGALIAEMENSMEELELAQAKLRLERARIDRLDKIVSHKVGARTPEDVSEEALKRFNMETGWDEAIISTRQAELRYDYTRLAAPFAGRIANLETKVNNTPKSGEAFCILVDDSKFEVKFPVLESEIKLLAVNQKITLKPYFMDSVNYTGTITEINPLIDENGMVNVKALVNNNDGKLVDGMNVKVFVKNYIPECLIVPKEAVVLRNNRQVIFSLRNDTMAYWNYVTTNLENSSSFTIIEGLNPGDTVITIGNINLAHDARIDFKFREEE